MRKYATSQASPMVSVGNRMWKAMFSPNWARARRRVSSTAELIYDDAGRKAGHHRVLQETRRPGSRRGEPGSLRAHRPARAPAERPVSAREVGDLARRRRPDAGHVADAGQ